MATSSPAQYYASANTTTDEEEEHHSSSRRGGKSRNNNNNPPPPTQYRDDPSNSYRDNPNSNNNNNNNSDDEENIPSIFDWGDDSAPSSTSAAATAGGGGGKSKKKKKKRGPFQIIEESSFDPDVEIPFTPISLHDDDYSEEDSESDVSGSEALRPHNGLFKSSKKRSHNGNGYDQIDNGGVGGGEDGNQQRLFVGGGWGRHGSSTDYRCGGGNCCSCQRRFGLCSSTGCFLAVFVTLTLLCGYLGYEAGLPVTTLDDITTDNTNDSTNDGLETTATDHTTTTGHTTIITHGDQWLDWIKKEKNEIHLPHFHLNFTRHTPIIFTDDNNNRQISFPSMSQSDLLTQSQHAFLSCSERSIATTPGREACLSLCHGHYCCFEKDVEFGSCVTTPNSYCFAYAACENVIMDFAFTNVNMEEKHHFPTGGSVDVDGLNRDDLELLDDTCSRENVATLEGIRDCSAFCQHHLCCFSTDEDEDCAGTYKEECEAYEPCRIIAKGPDGGGGGGSDVSGGGSSITVTPAQVEKAVFDACYFGNDEDKVTQDLVSKCHSICSSRYCCFDSQTMVDSCRDTVGEEECRLYSLCEQMINDRGDEVQNFIELDMQEFGTDTDSSSSSSNNNAGGMSSSGTSYRPASNGGFIDESEFEATVNEVEVVCDPAQSGDDSWVSSCHAMCADYLCCFSTDGTGSNCKDVHGSEVCEAYAGCKVLQSSASSLTAESSQQQQPQQTNDQIAEQVQIDEMTETCVPKIRRDAGLRERCRKVCEPRDCCWKGGPGNCYQMNTDWCEEFSMCEILVV